MSHVIVSADNSVPRSQSSSLGFVDRFARGAIHQQLATVRSGEVTIEDVAGAQTFGTKSDLQAVMRIRDARFYRDLFMGGSIAAGETYVRGEWECDDLTTLLRIFARDANSTNGIDGLFARLVGLGHRLVHWWSANTVQGSRRNIAAHYDLGNDFYRLWLDETLAYSSGVFPSPTSTLREASQEKFDRICRTLDLQPGDRVMEIGTGWGGFALHAAMNYGCHVTTTTISREQFSLAEQRVREAGLSSRITLLQSDYRELTGKFDKLVSIEMIEAVGHEFLDHFFRKCGELLTPEGSMVLQAIVMPERGYARYLRTPDFINRYVFPGGCLPSLGAMLDSVARTTDLRLVRVEDFAGHYAETLRRWRQAFHAQLDAVRQLGYKDDFIRLWTYYLCYCEAAFAERCIGLLQIQFDKASRRQ